MNTTQAFRYWMRQVHDESARIMHLTVRMVHEKEFWGMVGILALITALSTVLMHWGHNSMLEFQTYPHYMW